MIREHKRFGGDSWFAGGAFTWDSMMVSNTITMNAMLPAMDACAKEGVENIFRFDVSDIFNNNYQYWRRYNEVCLWDK